MGNMDLDFLKRLAKALAAQFGNHCEIVVHDLRSGDPENTIVAIENGHITNRKLGDGPSHVVLEALNKNSETLEDHLDYLAKTHDGRIMKSSTIYIRDEKGKPEGIFSINYDITELLVAESAIKSLLNYDMAEKEPERIPRNVNELLDELIDESVRIVGKPAALMTKEEKIRAIQFLNTAGAFLITKSGDKVSNFFGISKYTLYTYIDASST